MNSNLSMEQIRIDVKNVTDLNNTGRDITQISETLGLSRDYIQTILTCAQ